MELFFDFTGSNEPDYPVEQPTMAQMLTQSAAEKEGKRGPLVLVGRRIGNLCVTIPRPVNGWGSTAFEPTAAVASGTSRPKQPRTPLGRLT